MEKSNGIPQRKKSIRYRINKDLHVNKYLYLMAIPIVLYYLIFHYIPMGGLIISFQNFKPALGYLESGWVGLQHFIDFFTSPFAWRVIRNTLLINVYDIVFGFPAPILLALLINEVRNNRFKRLVQTFSYLPHFISLIVICSMIVDFSASTGIFNNILAALGFPRGNLLVSNDTFRTVFVSTGIWQHVGWGSIIYLATLSSIDPTLYEAAQIDGAGRFKQVWHITLPSLLPTIIVLLILRLGNIMSQGFEKIILLYNPLTYETADVISSYVYRMGLLQQNYSYGTAVGLFNSVINFTILVLANRLSKKTTGSSLW